MCGHTACDADEYQVGLGRALLLSQLPGIRQCRVDVKIGCNMGGFVGIGLNREETKPIWP